MLKIPTNTDLKSVLINNLKTVQECIDLGRNDVAKILLGSAIDAIPLIIERIPLIIAGSVCHIEINGVPWCVSPTSRDYSDKILADPDSDLPYIVCSTDLGKGIAWINTLKNLYPGDEIALVHGGCREDRY